MDGAAGTVPPDQNRGPAREAVCTQLDCGELRHADSRSRGVLALYIGATVAEQPAMKTHSAPSVPSASASKGWTWPLERRLW